MLIEFRYRKFQKIGSSHLCSEALPGYSQEMQFLPPNTTAQVLVLSRYEVFCDFSKKISENLSNFFFQNLKFLTLLLGAVRVLSGVPNLACKFDYSILGSFRDMTS